MPFEIVRNDIVNMQVDAVVNTANPNPVIGSGVDSGIHKKAGHELLMARQKIGCIDFGNAVITPGFNLDAKYVIHTVGLLGRMVNTERSRFYLRVTGNPWHWLKNMNASLSPSL